MNKENLPTIGLIIVAVSVAISVPFAFVFDHKNTNNTAVDAVKSVTNTVNNIANTVKIYAESNKDKSTATTPKWVHPYNHCLLIVTQKNPNLDLYEAKGMCSELLKNKGKV